MPDRPIIFSAPMVRALLDGRKTQTRRLLRPKNHNTHLQCDPYGAWWWWTPQTGAPHVAQPVPYAHGDRLYVREAIDKASDSDGVFYRADYDAGNPEGSAGLGWRPSIHMPRWASRLTLTVTEVRVQRLQEITEADAVAEGVTRCAWAEDFAGDGRIEWHVPEVSPGEYPGLTNPHPTPIGPFSELWERLHGPAAWDANPWVVAVSFTVQRGNIDQIGGANA